MKPTLSARLADFDQWAELASRDPVQFEQKRREVIDEFLQSVSSERRLHLQRLQWRVDRIRERCATPMAATIAISEMMWEAFYDLHDRYQDQFGSQKTARYKAPAPVKSATILPFESPAAI